MKSTSYRLAHYKIRENVDGSLWWESYAGFARTQSGRCFIESDVLFFEPAMDVSEPGLLIMEYNEALDALPQWAKTSHYCTNYSLRFCHNDKILSYANIDTELKRWTEEATIVTEGEQIGFATDKSKQPNATIVSIYQLGRYKIIEGVSGELRWNTCTHLNRLKVGRGVIEGKILFINGKTIEESEFSKREFYNQLNRLPKWKKTLYYCTNYNLKLCQKTDAFGVKQSIQKSKVHYKHLITNRRTHGKRIAEISTVITTYKNRFLKRKKNEGFIAHRYNLWAYIGSHNYFRIDGRTSLRNAFQDSGSGRYFNNRHCRRVFRCLGDPHFRGSGKRSYNQADMDGHRFDLFGEVPICIDLCSPGGFIHPIHCHCYKFDMGDVNSYTAELLYCKNPE